MIISLFMPNITAYHGTGKLESILNSGAVLSYSQDKLFDVHIEEYHQLTEILAGMIKEKRKAEGNDFRYEYDFWQANGSSEALADIVEECGLAEELSDGGIYRELKRLTHVFLSDYEVAKKFANNGFKSILEFEIPDELVRQGISGRRYMLVRKKVDLSYLRRIYVEEYNIKQAKSLLSQYGINNVEVDAIK